MRAVLAIHPLTSDQTTAQMWSHGLQWVGGGAKLKQHKVALSTNK